MQISQKFVGVLMLLCSSVGMAATVAVVSTNSNPSISDTFSVTVSGASFPETAGATLGLTWDAAVVSVSSVTLAAGSPFPTLVADSPFNIVTVLGPLSGTLPSGDFSAFTINFTALTNGNANILLVDDGLDFCWTLASDSSCIPVTYTQANVVVGGLVAAPNIVVTDSVAPTTDHSVPFGNVALAVDATQTVTVTNSGTGALTISSVTSPTGEFSRVDNCPASVAAGANCTITVHFIPTAAGPASSSFNIVSNDADTPTVIMDLSGSGGIPDIVVTDNDSLPLDQSVLFGDVQENLNSTLDVTITNNGPGVLTLGTITTPADSHFTLLNNSCGPTLTPAANCVVTVQFAPTATGVVNSSFDIPSDDPDTPTITLILSGNGTPAPAPDIAVTDSFAPSTDLAIPFGSVQVLQTSAAATVTVTNSGNAPLTVSSVTGLALPFIVTGQTCTSAPIAASGTCTITVEFRPTVVGAAPNDTLIITSNDADTPTVDVVVSGTGLPIPAPDINVTDSDAAPNDHALSFGNVLVGQTSPAITVTVANTGDATLNVGQVAGPAPGGNPLPLPYTITNDNCSNQPVLAGQNCTFQVLFAPTGSPGTANEAFDIPSNDLDEDPVIENVSGTGTAPEITVTDSVAPAGDLDVGFGNVSIGDSSSETVTVTNSGTADLVIGNLVAPAAPFTIPVATDLCSGKTLAPAASCTIIVNFAPGAIQVYPGVFSIPSNDTSEASVPVTLSGSGVAAGGGGREGSGGSALDPATLLVLGLFGFAVKRRRRV